jgi:hypothetical protein
MCFVHDELGAIIKNAAKLMEHHGPAIGIMIISRDVYPYPVQKRELVNICYSLFSLGLNVISVYVAYPHITYVLSTNYIVEYIHDRSIHFNINGGIALLTCANGPNKMELDDKQLSNMKLFINIKTPLIRTSSVAVSNNYSFPSIIYCKKIIYYS